MHDKICILTGANSGLGKATALGLAKLGATVVLACRNKERGEAAQAEITANAIHPGLVKSNLLNDASPLKRWLSHLFSSSPEKAAESPVYYAISLEVEGISGKFFKGRKQIDSNAYSKKLEYTEEALASESRTH